MSVDNVDRPMASWTRCLGTPEIDRCSTRQSNVGQDMHEPGCPVPAALCTCNQAVCFQISSQLIVELKIRQTLVAKIRCHRIL